MPQPVPLRPREVPLRWDEAAAVVQTIADNVAEGQLDSVPPVEWLALDDEGSLHVVASPESQAPARQASSPAAALRDLFRQLVGSTPVPPELLSAIETTKEGAPIASAQAFSQAIGFFVRPSHHKGLLSVVARLRQDEEERRLQGGLEDLMRKARPSEPGAPAPGKPKPPDAATHGRRRRAIQVAVAVALALPLLVLGAALVGGGDESPSGSLIDRGRAILKEGREGAKSLLGGSEAPPAESGGKPPASEAAGTGRTRRPPSGSASDARPLKPTEDVASIAWILSHPVANLPSPSEEEEEEAENTESAATNGDRLYDSLNPDVEPASLVRPRLPSVPETPTPADQLGRLELVIDTTGKVERVRLLQTTAERRYYDAMLLSAAKAWVFAPARRDGVPVRYRLEVVLTH